MAEIGTTELGNDKNPKCGFWLMIETDMLFSRKNTLEEHGYETIQYETFVSNQSQVKRNFKKMEKRALRLT